MYWRNDLLLFHNMDPRCAIPLAVYSPSTDCSFYPSPSIPLEVDLYVLTLGCCCCHIILLLTISSLNYIPQLHSLNVYWPARWLSQTNQNHSLSFSFLFLLPFAHSYPFSTSVGFIHEPTFSLPHADIRMVIARMMTHVIAGVMTLKY